MIISKPGRGFDPRYISNLKIYLDCHDPAANGTLPSNNTAIATLTDKSGLGNTFLQATGAAQPIYKTGILNGCGVLRFDGASNFMSCANSANNTYSTNGDVSVFSICMTTTTPTVFDQFIMAKGGFPNGGWGAYNSLASPNAFGYVSTNVAQYTSTNSFVNNTFTIYSAVYANNSSITFYKNGNFASQDSMASANSVANANALTLGVDMGGVRLWPGDMRMILVYYKALNNSELSAVHGWLKSIAGI